MKNTTLRAIWILPNIFLYLLFIGVTTFVVVNADGLREINRMGIWVVYLMLLLAVAIFGSFPIRSWIKEGKI
ncbi:ABC-type multidrug transport system permease subunit [Chryseomicrobium aureum]|nr:ABC-type multidrug transport system permease subunit [Chryseomicrobium aureum]